MAKDHYIPASLIGRFSDDQSEKSRERMVYVRRKNTKKHPAKARNIGFRNNLYDVSREIYSLSEGRAVDNAWRDYEDGLTLALEALTYKKLTARQWVSIVVPFVGASCVRDPSYKERSESRKWVNSEFASIFKNSLDDTSLNLNRVAEMNRFVARAIASDWSIRETDGDLVTSDVGVAVNPVTPQEVTPEINSLIIPIGRRHFLELEPVSGRTIAVREDETWKIRVRYPKEKECSATINAMMAEHAQEFVAGTSEAIDSVESVESLGVHSAEDLDLILASWPFGKLNDMRGVHDPLRKIIEGNHVNLAKHQLDPFQGLRQLDPQVQFEEISLKIHASQFLRVSDTEISFHSV